ncbi:MAG: BMP family ABC transporter substrate-binding protein, partial [Anaerolineae bacterium]|nr:BMP family ABC transporter substrate-binding protein [Anaerolineae bacterium]
MSSKRNNVLIVLILLLYPAAYGAAHWLDSQGKVDFKAIGGTFPEEETPRATAVSQDSDRDRDGVPDSRDNCPSRGSEGYGVDAYGCPVPAPTTAFLFPTATRVVMAEPTREPFPTATRVVMAEPTREPFPTATPLPNVWPTATEPPPDSDGDGVNDVLDSCPNQGDMGYGIDVFGCPIEVAEAEGEPMEEAMAEEVVAEEAVAEEAMEEAEAEAEVAMAEVYDCRTTDLSNMRIGLVTDVGVINDHSFNQMAWEGVLNAEFCGAMVNYIETQDYTDYEENIAEFAESGYDVIVTIGYAMGAATQEAAIRYPDVIFIGVDQYQTDILPNLVGLTFQYDRAGFLAGALAARLTDTGTVAAVLGTDLVPPVVAYKEGFEAGARYIMPFITVISTYHPGDLMTSFTDPEWGAATASQVIDQNADVIIAAAGKTGNGALIEVANSVGQSGPPPFCIGVDTDQWLTVPEAHPCLVSSAMSRIDLGVAQIIAQIAQGNVPAGNFTGPIGLAPYHDFEDAVPELVKVEMERIAANLNSGALRTGVGVQVAEVPTAAPTLLFPSMTPAPTITLVPTEVAMAVPESAGLYNCSRTNLSGMAIGLVADYSIQEDVFYQMLWEGIQAAEACGAMVSYVENTTYGNYLPDIAQLADSGYDIIVTGFMMTEETQQAAQQYPDIVFISLGETTTPLPNLVTLTFEYDRIGFLAGALAARLTQSGTIASVMISNTIEVAVDFADGYEAG